VRRGYAARLRRQAAPIRLSAFRRRWGEVLRERERCSAGSRRRTRPWYAGAACRRARTAAELREIDAGGILHRRDEIVAGDGLAVVALEIQVHAAPEAVAPEQGVHHADDFRALVVDGGV